MYNYSKKITFLFLSFFSINCQGAATRSEVRQQAIPKSQFEIKAEVATALGIPKDADAFTISNAKPVLYIDDEASIKVKLDELNKNYSTLRANWDPKKYQDKNLKKIALEVSIVLGKAYEIVAKTYTTYIRMKQEEIKQEQIKREHIKNTLENLAASITGDAIQNEDALYDQLKKINILPNDPNVRFDIPQEIAKLLGIRNYNIDSYDILNIPEKYIIRKNDTIDQIREKAIWGYERATVTWFDWIFSNRNKPFKQRVLISSIAKILRENLKDYYGRMNIERAGIKK